MLMKKTLYILALCSFCALPSFAQTDKPNAAAETDVNIKVYQVAVSIADYNTAIQAVHYLLAGNAEKYKTWADTLAVLYFKNEAYQQAYILANQLLGASGFTELRMQVKAISAKNMQMTAEAIDAFKNLFQQTGRAGYGFEELSLEYGMRRITETIATGNKMLQILSAADSSKVNILKLDGKTSQQVSLRSAVHNILGLAYLDLKDKSNALLHLAEALKQDPEFEQAKNNRVAADSI